MASFADFKSAFKGDILTPTDSGYDEAIARWAKNSARKAGLVAFVKDAADVAAALKYATANGLEVAIRGGGHSAAGASSTVGGLVIDLSRYLDAVHIDPSARIAKVGGGALWGAVDKAAIQHGLATVGGTINHTGVGGLVVGGGYGWLTGLHGLSIDNLLQATVVTANGSVLTVNDKENTDLFWAIRGGGSNFGVVTEFHLKLHPQRKTVYSGILIFPPTALEPIAKFLEKWWKEPAEKSALGFVMTRSPPPDRHPCVVALLMWNGTEEEGRAYFKEVLDIGPIMDMTKEMPFEGVNELQNEFACHGRNVYFTGVTQFGPNLSQAKALWDAKQAFQDAHPDIDVSVISEFQPLYKVSSVADDATAFRSRGKQNNIVLLFQWDNDEKTDEYVQLARKTTKELGQLVTSTQPAYKESDNAGYGNFEGDVLPPQSKIHALFGDNYPRLQQIKTKYDPNSVFRKWFPIEPLKA